MTHEEAEALLAKLNRHLAMLIEIESHPGPYTDEELATAILIGESARDAMNCLQAWRDARALLMRVAA